MLRRQRDHYGQNKILHRNGSKENFLFIIQSYDFNTEKEVDAQPLCRGRVLLNGI